MQIITRSSALALTLLFFLSTQASLTFTYALTYPTGPNAQVTPGGMCKTPTQYRYPERIPYCARDVSSELKQQVIDLYVTRYGYEINRANRSVFKIDHYFPLCAGGSNEMANLWPQHKSVYEITDPVEQLTCIKMAAGKLKQAEALQLIKRVKNKLSEAPSVMSYLESL